MADTLVPLDTDDMVFTAVRSQGAGGQNVNKVSSAVHLRFCILSSSLPDDIKARLLTLKDRRITSDGEIVLKAQTTRSQDQNKALAIARLQALVDSVAVPPKPRKATKPTRSSQVKRVDEKTTRGGVKKLRQRVAISD